MTTSTSIMNNEEQKMNNKELKMNNEAVGVATGIMNDQELHENTNVQIENLRKEQLQLPGIGNFNLYNHL